MLKIGSGQFTIGASGSTVLTVGDCISNSMRLISLVGGMPQAELTLWEAALLSDLGLKTGPVMTNAGSIAVRAGESSSNLGASVDITAGRSRGNDAVGGNIAIGSGARIHTCIGQDQGCSDTSSPV